MAASPGYCSCPSPSHHSLKPITLLRSGSPTLPTSSTTNHLSGSVLSAFFPMYSSLSTKSPQSHDPSDRPPQPWYSCFHQQQHHSLPPRHSRLHITMYTRQRQLTNDSPKPFPSHNYRPTPSPSFAALSRIGSPASAIYLYMMTMSYLRSPKAADRPSSDPSLPGVLRHYHHVALSGRTRGLIRVGVRSEDEGPGMGGLSTILKRVWRATASPDSEIMMIEGSRSEGEGCKMPSGLLALENQTPQSSITMKDLGTADFSRQMLLDAQSVGHGTISKDLSACPWDQVNACPHPPSAVEQGTGDAPQLPTHPATAAHGVVGAMMHDIVEDVPVGVVISAEPCVQGGGQAMGVETDSGSDAAVGPSAPLAASERANMGEPAAGKDLDMCGEVVVMTGAGEREEQQVLNSQSSSPQPSPSSTDGSRVSSDTGSEPFPSTADLQLPLRIWRAAPAGEAEVTVDALQAWLSKMTRRPVHVESTSEDVFVATWSSLSDVVAAYGAIKKKGYINGRRVLVCRPSVRLAEWLTSIEGLIDWHDAATTAPVPIRTSSTHRTLSPGSTPAHARAHTPASSHAHPHKRPSHRAQSTTSGPLFYAPLSGSSGRSWAHRGFDGGGAWHMPPMPQAFAPPPPFPQHDIIGPYAVGPHGLPYHPPLHGAPASNPQFIYEPPPHVAYGQPFTHPHMMMAPDEHPPPYCYYEQIPASPPMYMGPHVVPMHMHVPPGMQGYRVDGYGGGSMHGAPPQLHPHAHAMQQHQRPQGQQSVSPRQQLGPPGAHKHSPGPLPPPFAPSPHTSPPPLHQPHDHQQQQPPQPPAPPLLVLAPKGKQALTIVPADLPTSAADKKTAMPGCLKEVQAASEGFVVEGQGEKLKSEVTVVKPSNPPHPSPTLDASVYAAGRSGAAKSGGASATVGTTVHPAITTIGGVQARSLVRQPSKIPDEEDDAEGIAAVIEQHDHEEEEDEEDEVQREHRRLREEGVVLMAIDTDDDTHSTHTTSSPLGTLTAILATPTHHRVQKTGAAAAAERSHTPSARTQAVVATSPTTDNCCRHYTHSHMVQVSSAGSGGLADVVVWVGGPGDDEEMPSAGTRPSPRTPSSSSSTRHGASAALALSLRSDPAPLVLTPTRATPRAIPAPTPPHTAKAKAHAQPLHANATRSPSTSDRQQHLPLEQAPVVVTAVPQTATLVPPQYRFPKPPPPLQLRITMAKSLVRLQTHQSLPSVQGTDVAAKGVGASVKTGLREARQYHPLFGLSDFVIRPGSSSPSSATQTRVSPDGLRVDHSA